MISSTYQLAHAPASQADVGARLGPNRLKSHEHPVGSGRVFVHQGLAYQALQNIIFRPNSHWRPLLPWP